MTSPATAPSHTSPLPVNSVVGPASEVTSRSPVPVRARRPASIGPSRTVPEPVCTLARPSAQPPLAPAGADTQVQLDRAVDVKTLLAHHVFGGLGLELLGHRCHPSALVPTVHAGRTAAAAPTTLLGPLLAPLPLPLLL